MQLTGSLVLFHNDSAMYEQAIQSFLNGCNGVLYIVDNSSVPLEHELFHHSRVRYYHYGRNLGFGAAHNQAIAKIDSDSNYHLILNPDISFSPEVLAYLESVMRSYPDVGALMPRINYSDGSLQRLCKLLPTPVDLIFRRFIPMKSVQNAINRHYELQELPQDRMIDVPTVSGCFLIFRTNLVRRLGGFDERFFMYMEDVDLVRRIGDVARVVYVPQVSVIHAYAKGSYRDNNLLLYHIISAIRYFAKWGWWFDSTRRKRNAVILSYLREVRLLVP